MADFDLSTLPSTSDEMQAYSEKLRNELTKAVEENGINEVIPMIAMAMATTAFFSNSHRQTAEKANENFECLLEIVKDLKETFKVQTTTVSMRLEALEGN
ncbi:hypothetical protein SynBIOSE41_02145 [Synechococcus sp. BIOS-E4-1]|nr:hypothetical protein SynBIOSE41_02145 [Synechococcus sp. BIOS-E4-1]